VLGVSPDAPDEVIRAAYRALAAKYHPDRNPGNSDAELQLKRLNAAFAVLGNAAKRRQYDELTRSPAEAAEPQDKTPKEPQAEARTEPARWNRDRSLFWFVHAVKLALLGAIIGALVSLFLQPAAPVFIDPATVADTDDSTADAYMAGRKTFPIHSLVPVEDWKGVKLVSAGEVDAMLIRDEPKKGSDDDEIRSLVGPPLGAPHIIAKSAWLQDQAERKAKFEQDQRYAAAVGAALGAAALASIPMVAAAWFLLLVLVGQLSDAVRRGGA
jgi:hypothetical protein